MLPQAAFDLLQFDLRGAADEAARGDVEQGRAVLEAGLARAVGACQAGKTWGEELVQQYEAALANYARQFGPQRSSSP
jgi:hypothetical protein